MSPERWQRVKLLLDRCLEQPSDDWASYLADSCSDPEIRNEVLALLSAHAASNAFLENSPAHDIAVALHTDSFVGEKLGAYVIEAAIGHGGMGTVYRAAHADEDFRLQVAVKVVNHAGAGASVLTRFRTERQILARLDHPYIAHLLDGGTTPSGLPYFVMEYIEGRPLHEYCDDHRLSLRDRLHLFRKICEAVSYAHRHLIVHRDLKPSNILITADGTPKLLDFGIAKILSAREDDQPVDNTATVRMATPAYASPEQIRGGLVGTASDVYSLGVILYELLTGHSPYPIYRGDNDDMTNLICEREPTRPSQVVNYMENYDLSTGTESIVDATVLCERRATTPDILRRHLKGELDNIITMALRKEPERRYGSVDQLSEDIRRHLEGRPVIARKDTFGYRAGKFIVRHRVGVALGAAAVLLLCITTALAVRKAQQLAARVEEDHKLATSFLVDIHDSIAKLPGATPARQALLERSLRYMNGLARDTGSNIELQRALALAYERVADLQAGTVGAGLGQPTAALETYLRAQGIREQLAKANPNDSEMQADLVRNYLLASFLIGRAGSQARRLEYDRKALAVADSLVRAAPQNTSYAGLLAKAHVSAAYGYTFSDEWDKVRRHFREALAIRTRLAQAAPQSPGTREELANIYYRIGTSYAQTGSPALAVTDLRKALDIQQALAREQPDNQQIRNAVAATQHFLGVAFAGTGDLRQALASLSSAIAIREDAVEDDPRDARSRAMLSGNYSERAVVQLRAGDRSGALAGIKHALELQTALYQVDPASVPTRMNLAEQYARLGAVHVAFAEHARHADGAVANWGEAAAAYRHSEELYANLRSDGHLKSKQMAADADRVHEMRIRCEREAHH